MKIFLQVFAWLIVVVGLIAAMLITMEAPASIESNSVSTAAHDAAISLAWGVGLSAVISAVFFGALSAIVDRLETIIACVTPAIPPRTITHCGKEMELRAEIQAGQWVAKVFVGNELSNSYGYFYSNGLRPTPTAALDYLEGALKREETRLSAKA